MNENIILAPLMFFSLAFSTLLLAFCIKKIEKDKVILFFCHFLLVVWLFSFTELINYFDFLPVVIEKYLLSILLFLMHYFLLFQYFFVARYLIAGKSQLTRVLFGLVFLAWTAFVVYPPNATLIVEGQNQLLQALVAGISLSPAIFFVMVAFYQLLFNKLKVPKKLFFLLVMGLIIPILVTFEVINLQLNQSIFSLDLIFTSLSIAMYFYTFLLYFDESRKIISSFKEKTVLLTSLLILVPLTFRSMYIYIFPVKGNINF